MKKIFIIALLSLIISGCKDFEELQVDPNKVTQTHPSLLLTNIEVTTFSVINLNAALASRMLVYTDAAANEQYYGWQRSDFGRYGTLRQITKMEEEADRLQLENYKHIGTFLKAVHFIELSKTFGDIPFTEALRGATEANYKPQYDKQEDIYIKVLDDLQTAALSIDASKGPVSGDVIFNGDILKWKKLMNSFSLRILISLSLKTGNTKLNVIDRFKEIVDNPGTYPLIESNSENAALVYLDISGNRYPYYNSNSLKTAYYMDESFVNLLKERNDPRLFIFADRKPLGLDLAEDDFDAYGGLGGSASLDENSTRLTNGEASPIDARFHSNATNEPTVLLSYAETEFNLAEAAKLGWIADDPQLHYENGVKASMDFYHVPASTQNTYLTEELVAYDDANAIEQINTQKYIGYFMNGGWEGFYNHLRTGFPAFDVSGSGILNDGNVPKRWMYPQSELLLNQANVAAAIERQYPDGDDINGVMWLLQSE